MTGTHLLIHPNGERRFIVINYFLKFGLTQFAGTRTVHVFKLNLIHFHIMLNILDYKINFF